jgi:ribosomal protein S18 acetylase RimI-like enzyme
MSLIKRLVNQVLWQTFWLDNFLISFAGRIDSEIPLPSELQLIRIAINGDPDLRIAEVAMRAAGEESNLVSQRIDRGDQFFGWLLNDKLVSFGWVTYGYRKVGQTALCSAEGRAFLYNFHTFETYRRRGLYQTLLLQIRRTLTNEGYNEFIIDANTRNASSIRGIVSAGFDPVARITRVTVLQRWQYTIFKKCLRQLSFSLFKNQQQEMPC